jgi:hypothetical protein
MSPDQRTETVPIDMAAWDEALMASKSDGRLLPSGDGWLKLETLAAHWNLSMARTSERANNFCRVGLAERFEGRDVGTSGCLVRAVWFRLLKPSK